jgi:hypothetical protein
MEVEVLVVLIIFTNSLRTQQYSMEVEEKHVDERE